MWKKFTMGQKDSFEFENKILVTGGKGGVGKTTIAVNLAFALSKLGHKTGLLDIDIHGPNAARILGMGDLRVLGGEGGILPLQNLYGLKFISISCFSDEGRAIIWRGPLKHKAVKQMIEDVSWGQLDHLIIDCPPGTGDEIISVHQLLPGSKAIIVSAPQKASVEDASRVMDFLEKAGITIIGLIENMSGGVFGFGGVEEFARSAGVEFLGSVKLSREIASSGDGGLPFLIRDSQTSRDFFKIVDTVIKRVEGK